MVEKKSDGLRRGCMGNSRVVVRRSARWIMAGYFIIMGPTALSKNHNPTNVQAFHQPGAPAHRFNPKTRNRTANNHVIVLSISLAIVFSPLLPRVGGIGCRSQSFGI